MSADLGPQIESRIHIVRGQRVMVDVDLAGLYGVPTKRLNEQVKRNRERFPTDFMFQLTLSEKTEVVANCDHLARLKFSRTLPFAFTEHGAIQAANVLATRQAVEMGIYVVRAFIQLRTAAALHADLASRLTDLERKTESLAASQEAFSQETRWQLRQLVDALRGLMTPPDPPRRPIGFVTPEEKSGKKDGKRKKAAHRPLGENPVQAARST